jgi:hypothetical protein
MDLKISPVPVFTNSSDVRVRESEEGPFIFFEPSGSSPSGWLHWHHRWRCEDTVDQKDRLEITVYVEGGKEAVADVTPRRMRGFRLRPGEAVRWANLHLAEGDRSSYPLRRIWAKYPEAKEIQDGAAAADEHGLVTLPGVIILPTCNRIVITRQ